MNQSGGVRECVGVVGPKRATRLSAPVRPVNRTGRELLPGSGTADNLRPKGRPKDTPPQRAYHRREPVRHVPDSVDPSSSSGAYLLLTMPGEPLVEYGLKLERGIADRAIPIVVGYANGGIGYIATAEAYKVGGYEPTQSPLLPAEAEILRGLNRLADRVVGDVFETFSTHPPGTKASDQVRAGRAGLHVIATRSTGEGDDLAADADLPGRAADPRGPA